MKEIQIQNEVLKAVNYFGYFWRNNSGAYTIGKRYIKFGLKGSADILGVVSGTGLFLAIEVKANKGKQSEEQKLFQRQIEAQGGRYILVKSSEEAVNECKKIKEEQMELKRLNELIILIKTYCNGVVDENAEEIITYLKKTIREYESTK